MTADRQRAHAWAAALLPAEQGRPRDLKAIAPDASAILRRNMYGRFERRGRGVYRLTDLGEAALQRWPDAAVTAAM